MRAISTLSALALLRKNVTIYTLNSTSLTIDERAQLVPPSDHRETSRNRYLRDPNEPSLRLSIFVQFDFSGYSSGLIGIYVSLHY